ncbi:MAG: hypothetical protein E6Q58_04385 [Niabella sp.]|nr:MAG: hypothetical protein E6Q58_04385 [Niabella sp.]
MISKLQDYANELSEMTTPSEKIETLIFYGSQQKSVDGFTDKDKVRGCISQTFINANLNGGVMTLKGTSESIVIRGLVFILVDSFSGQRLTAAEFEKEYDEFLNKAQITENMLPSRANSTISIKEHILKDISA